MDLREGEKIMRVYHHHFTPYLIRLLKVLIGALPFFFLAFIFSQSFTPRVNIIIHLVIFFIFSMLVVYVSLIYWLDKLVVTNMRVVYIDWKYLTIRAESEALLDDIQDIKTQERGILAHFRIFDYGTVKMDTASSHVTILFTEAPDPEAIRQYIYHVKGLT